MNKSGMEIAAENSGICARDKFVLIVVASYKDLEGRGATVCELVARTGYTKSTVIAALVSLEKMGSILVKKESGYPNFYTLSKKDIKND